jgi:hypothetical protein
MQVLAYLFLRRFRKHQYTVPLLVLVVLRILLWALRGIAEEFIFSTIASYIPLSGEHIAMLVGLIVGLGIVGVLVWMYVDTRREFTTQRLQDSLKEMHKRLLRLKDMRLTQAQPDLKQMEITIPVLMDKLELVDLDRWNNFVESIARQMKRSITEQSKRKGTWPYKVAGVASKIRKDLANSRTWTVADLDIIADWLDSQSWGLRELRDNDKQWNKLYELIEPFTRDSKLRALISKHISVSYGSCGILLVISYAKRWPTSIPLAVLHEALIGSPLSPVKISFALSEILGDIDKRMNILKSRTGAKRK